MAGKRPEKSTEKSRKKPRVSYLKNAWIRKDADGHIYLFICSKSGQHAMLNLTALNPTIDEQIKNEINPERKTSIPRKVLEEWISDQDGANVKIEKRHEENGDDEFPELISG